MRILTLDTTGPYGSAALIDEQGNSSTVHGTAAQNHLHDTLSLVTEVLARGAVTLADLTHLAVAIGPGSFTGIRIGVTTVRTMAQMLALPCIAVPTLEGMAYLAEIALRRRGAASAYRYRASIINARRGQAYAALWERPGASGGEEALREQYRARLPQRQYMIDEFLEAIREQGIRPEQVYIIGDGIDAYEDNIRAQGAYALAPKAVRYQDAAGTATAALSRALRGEVLPYEQLLPDYMRLTEAERRLAEGSLSNKIAALQQGKQSCGTASTSR